MEKIGFEEHLQQTRERFAKLSPEERLAERKRLTKLMQDGFAAAERYRKEEKFSPDTTGRKPEE